MAEQLDRYELERKIEKLEFLLEEKTKRVEQLEQEHRTADLMLDWQAENGCKLEEKLQIALEALEFYASEDNYSHFDSKNNIICDENCGDKAREAIKQIKGDDND